MNLLAGMLPEGGMFPGKAYMHVDEFTATTSTIVSLTGEDGPMTLFPGDRAGPS